MAKRKADTQKIKNLNLLSKVSTTLQDLLDKHGIEYTPADISLLRNIVISNLSNVGINQSNYNNKKYDELEIYTMNLEINRFYHTTYSIPGISEKERRINKIYNPKKKIINTSEKESNKLEKYTD